MNQAIRNANDGIALAQTADGALGEVTNMLQRVRELAVQSASGTYSDDDRTNMQTEVAQLGAQIDDITSNTKFNGVSLFEHAGRRDGDDPDRLVARGHGRPDGHRPRPSSDATRFGHLRRQRRRHGAWTMSTPR